MNDICPPRLPKNHLPKAISHEHIEAMMNVVQSPRERTILLFFQDTGCRASEALSLTWKDISTEKGIATVVGKGNKMRTIFLQPVTCQALNIYRKTVPSKPDDRVWWGKQGPLTYSGLYHLFKRLAKEAGIDDSVFSPHAWRHAFGRDTTINGIPTTQLQDLMGHSSIEVTKIYTQFDTDELKKAHARYSPVRGEEAGKI